MEVLAFRVEKVREGSPDSGAGGYAAEFRVIGSLADVMALANQLMGDRSSVAAPVGEPPGLLDGQARVRRPRSRVVAPDPSKLEVLAEPAKVEAPPIVSESRLSSTDFKVVKPGEILPDSQRIVDLGSHPHLAPKAAEQVRAVQKIHNGEFAILAWQEDGKHVAQVEVGQDPAISGLTAEGPTQIEALGNVAAKARDALVAKTAPVSPSVSPEVAHVAEVLSEEVPPVLHAAATFGMVIDWMLAKDGGGFGLDDAEAITRRCEAYRAKVPALGRLAGDMGDRVRRILELRKLNARIGA